MTQYLVLARFETPAGESYTEHAMTELDVRIRKACQGFARPLPGGWLGLALITSTEPASVPGEAGRLLRREACTVDVSAIMVELHVMRLG